MKKVGENVNILKISECKKNYIRKLERKRIMTWTLIWLNWSVATINATFQLLDIYKYR